MDAKAAKGLQDALWSIHGMLGKINRGQAIIAEEVDELEQNILAVEDHLEWEWD